MLEFGIETWLGSSIPDPLERESLAALRISAGLRSLTVTEVEDRLAHTVRGHINVPAHALARWLVINWWRLRWEPWRPKPPPSWSHSHSMAAISGDYAWPALTFASDGESVQLRLQADATSDVSAIRYLRDVAIDVPALDFERAVDRFLDQVDARLASRLPGDPELAELRAELQEERTDPALARLSRLQAMAGIDPGAATEEWLASARDLVGEAGASATDEIVAAVPSLDGGLATARELVSAMRRSPTKIQLGWARLDEPGRTVGELPWERGARWAAALRARLGLPAGPVANGALEPLLAARLPLPASPQAGVARELRGGYRNGVDQGRTAVLVTSPRPTSQRFYLARLIAAALSTGADEHVLPVSNTFTARQKVERAFAQEFLCPWADLHAMIEETGTDDDGIAEAAAHFGVDERVVLTTLVNKDKADRGRLHA